MRAISTTALASTFIAASILLCSACTEARTMNSTSLPPKIQKLFEKTKPVCFGRFVIDVPAETTVVPGPQEFGPTIETIENGAKSLAVMARKKRDEIMATGKTIARSELRLFDSGPTQGSWTVAFWRTDSAKEVGLEDIWGYFKAGPHGFLCRNAIGDKETRTDVENQNNYIATHLRARTHDEIPSEPGVCLNLGFIADDSGKFQEIFGVGFRFPSLPDVSFSVSSNKDGQTDPPLSEQRREAERAVQGTPMEADFRKVKVLREGKRKIYQWAGEEALFHRPKKNGDVWQEFQYAYPGIRYDKNNPGWDATMFTGVDGNTAGGKASSLTDEEAVALWDAVLSTVRLRVPK
jgi:hypothetical protein